MAERNDVSAWPLVSIITINYNQAAVTEEFLRSARELTYPNYEIVVVENGSDRNPFGPAQAARFPGVRLVTSPANLGFAGGNNLGIRHARGTYFLLINNDTEPAPDLIERLLEPFAANPAVGVSCPKIRFADQRHLIQYAGYRPLNAYTGQTTPFGGREVDRGQYDQSGPTHYAHGCAMLVSRAVTERAGLLNEAYFLYYEELDWSHRIRRAGYQIFYQASALVYHKQSVSVGRSSPLKVYYLTRNRIRFMRDCAGQTQFRWFALYFACVALPWNLARYAGRGQWAYLRAYWRGVRHSFG